MAQYTVTAGCGHTTTVSLTGPVAERTRRIAWMEGSTGKCNSCYAASKRAETTTAMETEVAALLAQLMAAPQPTPDQVAGLRSQYAAGMGTPARREALRRYLEMI